MATRCKAMIRRALGLAAVVLVVAAPAGPVLAQGEDDNNRRDRFDIPDDATSDNNRNLERILERFPDSDADGDGILTADEAREFIEARTEEWEEDQRNRRRGRGNDRQRGPTHRDVVYGDHERHRIDLYLAPPTEERRGPRPLVIFFHGGQFVTGDKSDVQIDTRALLASGISVASVNYRYTREEPFPACFNDAARAVQFLRLNADEYNLDPEQFAVAGQDAGANLALYLALHDDLAERPNASERERRANRDIDEDPYDEYGLMAQSTRVVGAMAINPLASFDPRYWETHGLPLNNHERYLPEWLGVNYLEPFDDGELIELVETISPAQLVSDDDPPLLLLSQFDDLEITERTSWTIMRLHPRQCQLLGQAMRDSQANAIVRYRNMPNDPNIGSAQFFPELFGLD
ncbi:MAG: alpha/beta hydrolase fold domain-containing protein [Phycisphaerales bacterium JB063]